MIIINNTINCTINGTNNIKIIDTINGTTNITINDTINGTTNFTVNDTINGTTNITINSIKYQRNDIGSIIFLVLLNNSRNE